MTTVGILSDTHNTLLPGVLEALADCDYIIHAGDISSLRVLNKLREVAEVIAARGNCDYGPWAGEIPVTNVLEVEGTTIYIVHSLQSLDIAPEALGFDMVVYGHTHLAKQYYEHDVLYVNPGSASEPRGGQSPGLVIATINDQNISLKNVTLPQQARYY